jgi:hypothetical protein
VATPTLDMQRTPAVPFCWVGAAWNRTHRGRPSDTLCHADHSLTRLVGHGPRGVASAFGGLERLNPIGEV